MNGPEDGPPRRLFLAHWPDAATCAALVARQTRWAWPERARPTRPARLHLTLHFLGAVAEGRMAGLRQALAQVDVPPVDWRLDGELVWPNGVAVLTASRTPPAAVRLHAALAAAIASQGLALEPRPWRPHVSLARRAQAADPPAPADGPLHWRADTVVLAVSDHGYHAVDRWGARASRGAGDLGD